MAIERDWTGGPAKWMAVGVLGAASVAGMTWTIAQKYPSSARGGVIQMVPVQPAPMAPPAAAAPVHPPLQDAPPAPRPVEVVLVPEPEPPEVQPAGDLLPELAAKPRPTAVEAPTLTPPPVDRSPAFTRVININTAPAPELELLPGIGPALAGRIIEHRQTAGPFRTVEELVNVRGIGPKTLERLRPRVRVD